jgi:hypothetical protein
MAKFEDIRDTPVIDLPGKALKGLKKTGETPAELKARHKGERGSGRAKRKKKGERKKDIRASQQRAAVEATKRRGADRSDRLVESLGDLGERARSLPEDRPLTDKELMQEAAMRKASRKGMKQIRGEATRKYSHGGSVLARGQGRATRGVKSTKIS